ncbi:MAG TPA: hypothetical protein VNE00_00285, partial [Paraburkholderia sp.]|nr:hypothetical protein [Paraburkholderia sp.]
SRPLRSIGSAPMRRRRVGFTLRQFHIERRPLWNGALQGDSGGGSDRLARTRGSQRRTDGAHEAGYGLNAAY